MFGLIRRRRRNRNQEGLALLQATMKKQSRLRWLSRRPGQHATRIRMKPANTPGLYEGKDLPKNLVPAKTRRKWRG